MVASLVENPNLKANEEILQDIAGSLIVTIAAYYPDAVEINPFAGFGAAATFSANIKVGIETLLGLFAVGVMSIAMLVPRYGRITNYLVINYFFGKGHPVDLHDVFDAGKKFESGVSGVIGDVVRFYRTCNTANTDKRISNVFLEPGLYAIARSTFFTDIVCDGSKCYYHFYIRDEFKDALDLGRAEDLWDGDQDAYGATPYPINYDFYREYPCKQ